MRYLLLVLMASCAASLGRTEAQATLYVVNSGLDVVRVYDPYSKLGTVLPGEKRCLRLREYSGNVHLYLVTNREEAETPPLDSDALHWKIEVGTLPLRYSAMSLIPDEGGSCV